MPEERQIHKINCWKITISTKEIFFPCLKLFWPESKIVGRLQPSLQPRALCLCFDSIRMFWNRILVGFNISQVKRYIGAIFMLSLDRNSKPVYSGCCLHASTRSGLYALSEVGNVSRWAKPDGLLISLQRHLLLVCAQPSTVSVP